MKQTTNSSIKKMVTMAVVPHPITDEYFSSNSLLSSSEHNSIFQMIHFFYYLSYLL